MTHARPVGPGAVVAPAGPGGRRSRPGAGFDVMLERLRDDAGRAPSSRHAGPDAARRSERSERSDRDDSTARAHEPDGSRPYRAEVTTSGELRVDAPRDEDPGADDTDTDTDTDDIDIDDIDDIDTDDVDTGTDAPTDPVVGPATAVASSGASVVGSPEGSLDAATGRGAGAQIPTLAELVGAITSAPSSAAGEAAPTDQAAHVDSSPPGDPVAESGGTGHLAAEQVAGHASPGKAEEATSEDADVTSRPAPADEPAADADPVAGDASSDRGGPPGAEARSPDHFRPASSPAATTDPRTDAATSDEVETPVAVAPPVSRPAGAGAVDPAELGGAAADVDPAGSVANEGGSAPAGTTSVPASVGSIARSAAAVPSAAARLVELATEAGLKMPTRAVTVELSELDGARVRVAVESGVVRVTFLDATLDDATRRDLDRELQRALHGRGFDLAGGHRGRDGGRGSAERDGLDRQAAGALSGAAPGGVSRPAARPTRDPGGTLL